MIIGMSCSGQRERRNAKSIRLSNEKHRAVQSRMYRTGNERHTKRKREREREEDAPTLELEHWRPCRNSHPRYRSWDEISPQIKIKKTASSWSRRYKYDQKKVNEKKKSILNHVEDHSSFFGCLDDAIPLFRGVQIQGYLCIHDQHHWRKPERIWREKGREKLRKRAKVTISYDFRTQVMCLQGPSGAFHLARYLGREMKGHAHTHTQTRTSS